MSDLVALVPVADELFNAFNFSTASSWFSRSVAAGTDKEAHYFVVSASW